MMRQSVDATDGVDVVWLEIGLFTPPRQAESRSTIGAVNVKSRTNAMILKDSEFLP